MRTLFVIKNFRNMVQCCMVLYVCQLPKVQSKLVNCKSFDSAWHLSESGICKCFLFNNMKLDRLNGQFLG